EQLIEKVAVVVMGWMPNAGGMREASGWWSDPLKAETTHWNPLTDWNHTMEVVEKMKDGYGTDFMTALADQTITWEGSFPDTWANWFWVVYEQKNPQRAICLAALLAVSA